MGDIPHPNPSQSASHPVEQLRQPGREPRGTDKPPPTQPWPPPQGSTQVGRTRGAEAALGPSTTHSQICLLPGGSHQTPPGSCPPTLTPGLGVMDSSIVFGKELGLGPQCPRERQQPRGTADACEAGGLHPGGVGGQRDGGSVV